MITPTIITIGGKEFNRYTSPTGHYIRKIGTNEVYEEAVDPIGTNRQYEETEELIPIEETIQGETK